MRNLCVIAIVLLVFCNAGLAYQWQIETFGEAPVGFSLGSIGGSPALLYYGQSVDIGGNWKCPINYAQRTSEGWQIEEVVPASDGAYSTYGPLLAELPSGQPAICYTAVPQGSGTAHVWYSAKTLNGWEKEEVLSCDPCHEYNRWLSIRPDGTPIIGGSDLDVVFKTNGDWSYIRSEGNYALDYDLTPDGRVAAVKSFGYAITVGSNWAISILQKDESPHWEWPKIEVFEDGHAGIAYVATSPSYAALTYMSEKGLSWEKEVISTLPVEPIPYNITDLIVLPSGEPGIAYYYFSDEDMKYHIEYTWREGGTWLKDTVPIPVTGGLGMLDLELINGLPYLAVYDHYATGSLYFATPVPEPASIFLFSIGAIKICVKTRKKVKISTRP